VSESSESGEVSSSDESSFVESDMDIDEEEDLSNQSGSSQNEGLQERDSIFTVPPGQAALFTQDLDMKDSTNGRASEGGLGQDGSKPGGGTIGGSDAVHGGRKNKTGGPRTSGREHKENVRFDPNNSKTF
jgi:hypothetical protein